ncbi:MAG: threonine/serine exporter [Spirochaetales bacterium]|nr:MAG: threonine/serine exporter [Spirochaetales bacterium]
MILAPVAVSMAATFGFTIILHIRGVKMLAAAAGGGIGWLVYLVLFKVTSSATFASFAASLAVGVFSEIMAAAFKSPATVFTVCAIIPLVPGSGIYYTMWESIQKNSAKSISLGIETLFIAGAIAMGLAVSSSVFRIISAAAKPGKRKRPGRGPRRV